MAAEGAPVWEPLERFVGIIGRAVPALDCADFMWMGVVQRGTVTLQLYKHIDTRRYLNLDHAGHAWQYHAPTSTYGAHGSAMEAAEHVLDWS